MKSKSPSDDCDGLSFKRREPSGATAIFSDIMKQ